MPSMRFLSSLMSWIFLESSNLTSFTVNAVFTWATPLPSSSSWPADAGAGAAHPPAIMGVSWIFSVFLSRSLRSATSISVSREMSSTIREIFSG
uniref:Putative secreted protein n=1 Tax=Ixodes ricinus TaxID=34613 RepID=A0A147BFE8_IXORI